VDLVSFCVGDHVGTDLGSRRAEEYEVSRVPVQALTFSRHLQV